MRRFEWFIARRYIFSRERKLLFSAITLISFGGVALGVAALIIVVGVMDGADALIFGKIANLSPQVRIRRADNAPFAPDAALLKKELHDDPRVLFAEPLINRLTIVRVPGEEGIAVVQLIGQDEVGPNRLFDIPNARSGEPIRIGDRRVLLGRPALDELRVSTIEQRVWLVSSEPVQTALGPQPKIIQNVEIGAYWTGFPQLDAVTAFASVATVRELYRLPEGFDYIHIRLRDPFQAGAFVQSLALGSDFKITTWAEENSKFFSALKLEKFGMFVTMLLVVLVAAFSIIGTLILMAIEKTREIGILRAMGASPATVARIFMIDGMIIGVTGTALGVVLGLASSFVIPKIEITLEAVVALNHIPIQTRPLTVIVIIAVSLVICTLAALYPARQAARLNPIEALKFD